MITISYSGVLLLCTYLYECWTWKRGKPVRQHWGWCRQFPCGRLGYFFDWKTPKAHHDVVQLLDCHIVPASSLRFHLFHGMEIDVIFSQ